jgi:hypothetical protein
VRLGRIREGEKTFFLFNAKDRAKIGIYFKHANRKWKEPRVTVPKSSYHRRSSFLPSPVSPTFETPCGKAIASESKPQKRRFIILHGFTLLMFHKQPVPFLLNTEK